MESNEIILFAGLVAAVVNIGRPPSAAFCICARCSSVILNPMALINTISSVSYTHLDVYKRQTTVVAKATCILYAIEAISPVESPTKAGPIGINVPIDVYKRQQLWIGKWLEI